MSEPFFCMIGHTTGGALVPAGLPDPADPAPIGEGGDARLQRAATDRIDDEVDAASVGEAEHLGPDVGRWRS